MCLPVCVFVHAQSTAWPKIAADSFSVKEEQRGLCSSSCHLSGPMSSCIEIHTLEVHVPKMVFPCTSLCVSLHTPGREMAACTHDT